MVNTEDFLKRMELIFDYYNLNASSFADKIGVQRSCLSHLLSGRNKPSLDFVLKILENFPEVDLYWILNGKGSFPRTNVEPLLSENNSATKLAQPEIDIQKPSTSIPLKVPVNKKIKSEIAEVAIEKIVIFYSNGTFKEYNP